MHPAGRVCFCSIHPVPASEISRKYNQASQKKNKTTDGKKGKTTCDPFGMIA
jgi:hypothetical protein